VTCFRRWADAYRGSGGQLGLPVSAHSIDQVLHRIDEALGDSNDHPNFVLEPELESTLREVAVAPA